MNSEQQYLDFGGRSTEIRTQSKPYPSGCSECPEASNFPGSLDSAWDAVESDRQEAHES